MKQYFLLNMIVRHGHNLNIDRTALQMLTVACSYFRSKKSAIKLSQSLLCLLCKVSLPTVKKSMKYLTSNSYIIYTNKRQALFKINVEKIVDELIEKLPENVASKIKDRISDPETPQKDKDSTSNADVHKVFDFWVKTFNKNSSTKLTPKRRIKIKLALKNYSMADIEKAILGCSLNEFNITNGYTDIELICRECKQTDRYIEIYNKKTLHRKNSDDFAKELVAVQDMSRSKDYV